MTATSVPTAPDRPVQLLLTLHGVEAGRPRRSRSAPRPYWEQADAVDLGGELRARSRHARVALEAEALDDGTWRGHYDLMLPSSGVSGPTKAMPLRRDALSSGAHAVASHCRRVVAGGDREPRGAVRAAREVLRWLTYLDLL